MKPKRLGTALKEESQRLDEIRVYSYRHPEDYITPQKSALLQMRDRLDRMHRSTPAETVQGALCLIGLCAYVPEEISAEARNDARMLRSSLQLEQSVGGRGPLQ